MKKLTKKDLEAKGIFNPYGLAKQARGLMLVVSYRKQESGRATRSKAWQVWRVGRVVDPNAH